MAKAKAPKPPKPVKAKKEKPVKAKKEKAPKQPKPVKPRVPKITVKSDLYTLILMLTFLALVTACVFMYVNNAWHVAHM